MSSIPPSIIAKLKEREQDNALRELISFNPNLIDFISNDYLGLARSKPLSDLTETLISNLKTFPNGATGSRLLSGNSIYYQEVERKIATFHQGQTALIYNSGYDANIGLFSCLPSRHDVVLYDENIHASIRDGIRLSLAKSFSFRHNEVSHCKDLIDKNTSAQNIFIALESIYSMDGDFTPLEEFIELRKSYENIYIIVDEAHSVGVIGNQGQGLSQFLGIENEILARIYTFGKALGIHGATIVGSQILIDYLTNFSRSFIYTTAPSYHQIASIDATYNLFPTLIEERKALNKLSVLFDNQMNISSTELYSPIKKIVIEGNEKVKSVADKLISNGFNVRPILSPTVAKGQEQLRIILHAFNTEAEITTLCTLINQYR